MLESIGGQGRQVPAVVDEMSDTVALREFLSAFKAYAERGLPLFLLGTGIYENVSCLGKAVPFLRDALTIALGPLDLRAIADSYQPVFGFDDEEALAMAEETKGYAFASQLLGYLAWEAEGDWRSAIPDFCHCLDEYAYGGIWSRLSQEEHEALLPMACAGGGNVADGRRELREESIPSSIWQKLLAKGFVVPDGCGCLQLALPYFDRFVQAQSW